MGSPEQQLRKFLPGPTPSGWSLASNMIVKREDGALVVAYTGFGLTVTVEGWADRRLRTHCIKVERRDGVVSKLDLERVVDELYRRSSWRQALHDMAESHPSLDTPVVQFLFSV